MTTVVNNGKPCAIEQSLPKQRFVIIAEALDMPLLSKLIHSVKTLAKVKEVAYRHNYFVTEPYSFARSSGSHKILFHPAVAYSAGVGS